MNDCVADLSRFVYSSATTLRGERQKDNSQLVLWVLRMQSNAQCNAMRCGAKAVNLESEIPLQGVQICLAVHAQLRTRTRTGGTRQGKARQCKAGAVMEVMEDEEATRKARSCSVQAGGRSRPRGEEVTLSTSAGRNAQSGSLATSGGEVSTTCSLLTRKWRYRGGTVGYGVHGVEHLGRASWDVCAAPLS